MGIMVVWILVLLLLYMLVFALLIYNIIQYLFRQGRFKTFHIGFFYSISICIVLMRIAYFSMVLIYLIQWKSDKMLCPYLNLNVIDDYGVYLELILGI